VHNRPLKCAVVAGVKYAFEVAARGLHAVDHLGHGQPLGKSRFVIVLDACAGDARFVFAQRTLCPLAEQPLDAQQVSEVRGDRPAFIAGHVAKLFLAQPAYESKERLPALLQIGTQL
jgi:hypothetical protein